MILLIVHFYEFSIRGVWGALFDTIIMNFLISTAARRSGSRPYYFYLVLNGHIYSYGPIKFSQ